MYHVPIIVNRRRGIKIISEKADRKLKDNGLFYQALSALKPPRIILLAILLSAICFSGIPHLEQRLHLVKQWHPASDSIKDRMLYGSEYRLISRIQSELPPDAKILLFSKQDLALLPYYFYPRQIYQVGVVSDSDNIYMDLPPSPYPLRHPKSFNADYWLNVKGEGDFMLRRPSQFNRE